MGEETCSNSQASVSSLHIAWKVCLPPACSSQACLTSDNQHPGVLLGPVWTLRRGVQALNGAIPLSLGSLPNLAPLPPPTVHKRDPKHVSSLLQRLLQLQQSAMPLISHTSQHAACVPAQQSAIAGPAVQHDVVDSSSAIRRQRRAASLDDRGSRISRQHSPAAPRDSSQTAAASASSRLQRLRMLQSLGCELVAARGIA